MLMNLINIPTYMHIYIYIYIANITYMYVVDMYTEIKISDTNIFAHRNLKESYKYVIYDINCIRLSIIRDVI